MDFSAAQRAAQAEEYAEAIISVTPGFSQLSSEAQAVERQALVREAEAAVLGCDVHFWRSADRIMKTHSLVPPASASTFEHALRELVSVNTVSQRFDEVIHMLKTTFPATKNWISWWERRPIASMIFPAKSAVAPELAGKVPSTSNPVEHQHSLFHHAVGTDQEIVPGIEKIFLHVREMEKKHMAIKDGHFDAGNPRNRRPAKPPVFEENDGRAPDTIAALTAAGSTVSHAMSSFPPPPYTTVSYPRQVLQSYKWDSPNSCFFDNGMEIWFRAFSRWSNEERAAFLSSLPSESALADFFYHFQRRLRWVASPSPADIGGARELGLGQAKARYAIFTRWKLYTNPDSYGCATTWMHHAIRDNNTTEDIHLMFGVAHLLVGTCGSNHPCSIPVGTIKTNFRLNGFDLRTARAKYGPATSLTDYFASATPRIEMGNDVGGTTAVHALAISCDHPDCKGSFAPLVPDTIETLWPKILHINPDTGTFPSRTR
ncbi:hypothetical protein K438DRAFT_1985650 [Mycena galopus ATCC 62051]|nr:hypothetical protein K438DRAFT_1985650 [Mycena galopus ATCC 62051]